MSLLLLSSLFLLSSCQSTPKFSGTICVLDVSMSTNIYRLDDEGDAEQSIIIDDDSAMQNIEFLQTNLQQTYEILKEALSYNSNRILEPYDLLNDQEYLDQQIILDSAVSLEKLTYRPSQFQSIKERPLKTWRDFAVDNKCDQILRVKSHWVQVPNYQFLKKTNYFLGIHYYIELLDVKSSKLADMESIAKGTKPLNPKWMSWPLQEYSLNVDKQAILRDVFDTLSNDIKHFIEKN